MMGTQLKKGLGLILATTALVTASSALVGVTAADAGIRPTVAAGHVASGPVNHVVVGTKNFYYSYNGSPITQDGTMTINADGTWSLSAFGDAGWWVTVGKTITLSDSSAAATWIGKLGSQGIGTAKKLAKGYSEGMSTPYLLFYTKG
jgi:hypothetical protein